MTKLLLTGMSGFTGGYFASLVLRETDWEIYSLERITPRTNHMAEDAYSPRIHRLYHDFRAPIPSRILKECEGVKYIVHLGAEVHGLRSLQNPELFVHTNVMGTANLLEAARILKPDRFVYMSSAEALGAAPEGQSWAEDAPLRPSNPYAAAKGAGELLCQSYARSFGVPTTIVRTMNLFGPKQGLGKFVPDTIKKILKKEPIICHVGPDTNSGSRQWINVEFFVDNMWSAVLLDDSFCGSEHIHHIVGAQLSNEKVISTLALALDADPVVIFEMPGASHDLRYSITPSEEFKEFTEVESTLQFLVDTARWYQQNIEWLQ